MTFSANDVQEMDKIKSRYEQKRAALLPLLNYVQEKEGLITPESEKGVADYLGLPVVQVHEVVAFYHLFRQQKAGKCHFSVCQTTSCALRGAEEIIGHLKEKLKIKPGETTADGKFSMDVVECLGACEVAPMMRCNSEYVGLLDQKKIDDLIKENS